METVFAYQVRWPVGSLKWNVLGSVVNALIAMGQLYRIKATDSSDIGIAVD
jgi:hypothetical protein